LFWWGGQLLADIHIPRARDGEEGEVLLQSNPHEKQGIIVHTFPKETIFAKKNI